MVACCKRFFLSQAVEMQGAGLAAGFGDWLSAGFAQPSPIKPDLQFAHSVENRLEHAAHS